MIKELFDFLWQNKKWWLLPPIVIFVLFGILVTVSTSSPISPLIYMLF